jgi:hypothetical protein
MDVNGIPTESTFRKRLGRKGISKVVKKKDSQIDNILNGLRDLESFRSNSTPDAIPKLRVVRRACIAWIGPNLGVARAARPHITSLLEMIQLRFTTIIEHNFSRSKKHHQMQGVRRAAIGVHDEIRMRRANGVGKALDGNYLVERATRTHIPLFTGQTAESLYNREKMNTGLDLDDWVQQVLVPRSEDDPQNQYFNGKTINTVQVGSLNTQRVKYCSSAERWDYAINIQRGMITDASGNPYDTGCKETGFKGKGWAIYVVDFDGQFYSESHILNEFHHSSFLAGAPVQAAGELAVDRGRLVGLTNKTGHYKAGPPEMARALELLQAGGVDISTAAVNDPFRGQGRWFTGRAVLSADGNVEHLPREVEIREPPMVQP